MKWLSENLGSLIVLVLVALLMGLLVFFLVRSKRKSGCGGGCSGCAFAGSCPSCVAYPKADSDNSENVKNQI